MTQRPIALSILPMQLQVGDRFTDEAGEWEVICRPVSSLGGKNVRARVQQPGQPASVTDKLWPAHERIRVVRAY